MRTKINLQYQHTKAIYRAPCGMSLVREDHTLTPQGESMGGRWVLRNNDREIIGYDQYRNDIAERYDIDLHGDE
jgi:hypothetical protein